MSTPTIDFTRYAAKAIDFTKYTGGEAPKPEAPLKPTKVGEMPRASEVWQAISEPLVPQGRAEREAMSYATGPPTQFDVRHPTLGAIGHGLAGTYADTMATARGFTSPLAIGTLGLGGLARTPGIVGKLTSAAGALTGAGFGAQGVGQAAQGAGSMLQNGVTPENLQQTLQGSGQALLGAAGVGASAHEALPSIKRGGAGIELIKKSAYGDVPVPDVSKSLALSKELSDDYMNGGAPLPQPVAKHLLNENKQYTFRELHDQQQLINNALYKDRNVPASIRPQVEKISGLMSQELQQTADANGFGKDWAQQTADVRRGYGMGRTMQKVAPRTGQIVGGLAGAIAPELLPGNIAQGYKLGAIPVSAYTGARLGEQVGNALTDVTKAFANRGSSQPRIPVLPALPSPDAYTRMLLEAKEGKVSPGKADTNILRAGGSVKVKRIFNPPPAPPEE